MKAYRTFLGKELTESLRTYKVLLLVVIFLLLGVMNPLTAKISPDLMAAVMPDMNIQLPDPVSLDSWTQFFKNVGQIGMIVVIIIFGGVLSHELDGPLIPC